MSDPVASQEFFNPSSPFGALSGWEIQKDDAQTTFQRAQALKGDGDELAKRLFDEKNSVVGEYVATAATAAPPAQGDILNGYHVDTVQIRFVSNDFVRMTVNGHKHSGTSHPAGRKYVGSLTQIGVIFGCPAEPLGFVIPDGAGVRSYTYTLQGNHVDEPGSQGNFLAGNNYDGNETADIELCDAGPIAADTSDGWDLVDKNGSRGNTIAQTGTAQAVKHIPHYVASNG